ncbi:MAG: hypothetical protein HY530_06720 [Chloroflexi bacterium]|nr:hypothetical protein [Chloroflexota bacterium]
MAPLIWCLMFLDTLEIKGGKQMGSKGRKNVKKPKKVQEKKEVAKQK